MSKTKQKGVNRNLKLSLVGEVGVFIVKQFLVFTSDVQICSFWLLQ